MFFSACSASSERHLPFDTSIKLNEIPLQVSVFDEPMERARGLMYVKQLSDQEGALFVYDQERLVSFWMKNTLIPLDLLFFNNDGNLVKQVHNVQPCTSPVCKHFTAEGVRYVVEVYGGWMKRHNLLPPVRVFLPE